MNWQLLKGGSTLTCSFSTVRGLWPYIQHHPLSVACINGAANNVPTGVGRSLQIEVKSNLSADAAYKALVRKQNVNAGLIWRGDFHVAKQLVSALSRRIVEKQSQRDRNYGKKSSSDGGDGGSARNVSIREEFVRYRRDRLQRAAVLERIFVPLLVTDTPNSSDQAAERGNSFSLQYSIPLRRAPNVQLACQQAVPESCGPPDIEDGSPGLPEPGEYLVSLRGLMGCIGAQQWRQRGMAIGGDSGGDRIPQVCIIPHYGVFSPTHGEYINLVQSTRLPVVMSTPGASTAAATVYEVGTGTGVLAAVLAMRSGVRRVVATDCSERALACARANVTRLGLSDKVSVVHADLFPTADVDHNDGDHSGGCNSSSHSAVASHQRQGVKKVGLVVCNPPWLPSVDHEIADVGLTGGPDQSPLTLDLAVFDSADSAMLRGFLGQVSYHLLPPSVTCLNNAPHDGGECWLILSDLAERLDLRSRAQLLQWIEDAGLVVLGKEDAASRPRKGSYTASSQSQRLKAIRAAEIVSLWRLGLKASKQRSSAMVCSES